jgi:hypothetical protein
MSDVDTDVDQRVRGIEASLRVLVRTFGEFRDKYEHDQAYNQIIRRKEQKATGLAFTKENIDSFFEKEFHYVMDSAMGRSIALHRLR